MHSKLYFKTNKHQNKHKHKSLALSSFSGLVKTLLSVTMTLRNVIVVSSGVSGCSVKKISFLSIQFRIKHFYEMFFHIFSVIQVICFTFVKRDNFKFTVSAPLNMFT